jgi:hypothetical protein
VLLHQVRFRTHLLTLCVSAAVTALGVLWQSWSSTAPEGTAAAAAVAAGASAPWRAVLVLQLCVGCLAPTVLLYFWEVDERAVFVNPPAPGSRRCSVDEPEGYQGVHGGSMMLGKAKAL